MSRKEAVAHRTISVGLTGVSYVAPALAGRIATYLWITPFPLAGLGRGDSTGGTENHLRVAWTGGSRV